MTVEEMKEGLARFIGNAAKTSNAHKTKPETLAFICRYEDGSIGFATCGKPLKVAEQIGVLEHAKLALYSAAILPPRQMKNKKKKVK
jgi:hypothetical protein